MIFWAFKRNIHILFNLLKLYLLLGKASWKDSAESIKNAGSIKIGWTMVKLAASFTPHLLTPIRNSLGKRAAPLSQLKDVKRNIY